MAKELEIRGAQQVIKNLNKISDRMFNRIVDACQRVQAQVVNDARSAAPVFLTTLRQSILPGDISVSKTDVQAKVTANVKYASYVEFGTRPHWPPVDALKDWAAKKLGDESLAFVVARAISRRGTKAQPYLGPALLKNQGLFRRMIMKAVEL
jgi:HK97 gp10 family phage protein